MTLAIQRCSKEVNPVLNPLAIGVTVGGLLLDVIVPRPKPRIGVPMTPLSSHKPPTRGHRGSQQEKWARTVPPVASGSLLGGVRFGELPLDHQSRATSSPIS